MAYDATDFVVTETPVHPSVTRPERIRALRDAILAQPQDFSMDDPSIHRCGTPVCFLGWTRELFNPDAAHPAEGGEELGLAEQDARNLFLMGSDAAQVETFERMHLDPFAATAEQGARVLDHYLSTGKIDWSVA